MKRKIFNNSGLEIKQSQIVHVDGCKVKGVDTSKFKKGDKLYLDPEKPGAFVTRKRQSMKADAWTAGLMFLGHILMICFRDYYENNVPYNIMLVIFALAAWGFLGKVILYDIKNN